MRDEDVPILPKHMERDPQKVALLEDWKTTLRARHTVASFRERGDLAVQVTADLGRTMNELAEISRIRENARVTPAGQVLDELSKVILNATGQGISEQTLLSALRRSVSELVADVRQLGPSVFLSHASRDRDIVRQIAAKLSKAGLKVWFDEKSLEPGVEGVRAIEKELDAADFVVSFISSSSVESAWVQHELQIALPPSIR